MTDADCKELMQRLELAKFKVPEYSENCPPADARRLLAQDMHRFFVYHVVGWLHQHGADLRT